MLLFIRFPFFIPLFHFFYNCNSLLLFIWFPFFIPFFHFFYYCNSFYTFYFMFFTLLLYMFNFLLLFWLIFSANINDFRSSMDHICLWMNLCNVSFWGAIYLKRNFWNFLTHILSYCLNRVIYLNNIRKRCLGKFFFFFLGIWIWSLRKFFMCWCFKRCLWIWNKWLIEQL